jgi:hypothetical protein
MKKKLLLIVVALFAFVALSAFVTPPTVTVTVNGSQFYQHGVGARLHDAWVYPCSGGEPVYYYVYPHPNDTWTNMDFQIKEVDYTWHYGTDGNPDYQGVAYGNCETGVKLTKMYVYYSEKPFFGETNTLWIFSSVGIPSVDIVKAWAGGTFPDGFDVVKGGLACQDYLYDNGTDKGALSCDQTMAWTLERRGWLRNDPDGPANDLLPKIEVYNKMLVELGLTPSL